jgi:hypothetical protein
MRDQSAGHSWLFSGGDQAPADQAGAPLPPDDIEVLQQIGCGAGEFMSDLNAFYPSLLTLTATRRKAMAEYEVLTDDAFVIADRYGNQTLFVRLSEGSAKTPVYYWSAERPRKTKQAFKSVWEFIKDELKGFEYACGR